MTRVDLHPTAALILTLFSRKSDGGDIARNPRPAYKVIKSLWKE